MGMEFCMDHWNRIRAAIDERGLSGLVHQGGAAMVEAQARELQGTQTDRDFDPLMSAHWAIVNNATQFLANAGNHGAALYWLTEKHDPIDEELLSRARARGVVVAEGTTWPHCPLCYLNLAHELTCDDKACTIPKKDGFEWMVARAADDALSTARAKGLTPEKQ